MSEEDSWWLFNKAEETNDPKLWREFLEDCAIALQNHVPLNSCQSLHIGLALQKILDGEDPKKALRLKKREGRPNANDEHEKWFWFVQERLQRCGDNRTKAVELAAKTFHKDPRTIDRAFDKFKGIYDKN